MDESEPEVEVEVEGGVGRASFGLSYQKTKDRDAIPGVISSLIRLIALAATQGHAMAIHGRGWWGNVGKTLKSVGRVTPVAGTSYAVPGEKSRASAPEFSVAVVGGYG